LSGKPIFIRAIRLELCAYQRVGSTYCCILGFYTMQCGRWLQRFGGTYLSPSSGTTFTIMLSLCLTLYPIFCSRHVVINSLKIMKWKYDAWAYLVDFCCIRVLYLSRYWGTMLPNNWLVVWLVDCIAPHQPTVVINGG